jgi:hypothetical protein
MVDIFELIEIDTAETKEELCEKEIQYIKDYNSYYKDENGYNMTYGGDCGTNGYVYTEEDKQKMSEISKKQFETPESRQKVSQRLKEYYESPEAREKCSKSQIKRFENSEARKDHSEAVKKYYEKNTDARQKLSDGKGYNKPFDVFTTDGTFIKTFNYQFEAMEYLQKEYHIISRITIGQVLSGNRNSSHGFVFKYK